MMQGASIDVGRAGRVLLLTSDYPPRVSGGVGTHVHDLASGLARRGWEPIVVTGGAVSGPTEACEEAIRVVRVPRFEQSEADAPAARRQALADVCSRLAQENPCNLFHLHDSFLVQSAERVCVTARLPLLLTQHSCLQAILGRAESGKQAGLPAPVQEVRRRERRALAAATAVICVSEVVASELRSSAGLLPPLHVVPNGVDVDVFSQVDREETERLRSTLAGPGERLVLFAGRPHGVKGLPELIVAAGMVRDEAPETRFAFLLCTDEPEKIAALRELGIGAGGSTFLANVPRSGMPAYFAAADLIAMPSRWEPFGLVALEAMAAARPVVVSDVAPLNQIVHDGSTGRVVRRLDGPRGVIDARELARTLIELLRMSPAALSEMGRRGRSLVVAHYSVDRMVERTLGVYRSLLAAEREPGLLASTTTGTKPSPSRRLVR